MSLEEPIEDYDSYDILEWVEGSKYAHIQQWPNYSRECWCSDYSSHDHHGFADKDFFPISTRVERYGFLWLRTRRVWTFRRVIRLRCRGIRGGQSLTGHLTPAIDLDGR